MTNKQPLGRLESVDPRSVWATENDFTTWLSDNLVFLGAKLGLDLQLIGTEVKVGDYVADIVAKDTSRNVTVVIENQLEESDHKHLGQLLTYTGGLDAAINIWIATYFRDDHRRAIDRQNERSGKSVEFYAVTIAAKKIGDSAHAPEFCLVAFPEVWWERTVNQRREPWNDKFRLFYEPIVADLTSNHSFRRKSNREARFCEFHSGYDGIWYNLAFTEGEEDGKVRVRLSLGSTETSKRHYNLLERHRVKIDREFAEPLEWVPKADWGESMISIYRCGSIDDSSKTLKEHRSWMVGNLLKFKKVFSPYLADLV